MQTGTTGAVDFLVGRRPRILLVEDNRTNLLVLRQLLKGLGTDIVCAENGRRAVDAASEASFDLILMDIQMPELDGIAATLEIRASERRAPGRARAAIVAITANTMTHQIAEYRAAGMDAWLAKPIGKDRLFPVLAEALGHTAAA